ncbi:LuxR C-terminal-related transcriptional regulator [Knoellia flava]|uniref:DNA-binding response regulator n=1 Tax=Knoellia flava TaxID=913969 RepID=A0A8H9FT69_9MICO|nr:response regulator transcription factor [Knoellia flava]GGB82108.1 DNA-binding response regulator [Knoellia flava]
MIRIVIADDQPLYRRGLEIAIGLEADLELAGEASTVSDLLRSAFDHRPHVLLTEVTLSGESTVKACAAAVEASPGTKLVRLTDSEDPEDLFEALRSGATGYLLKSMHIAEIIDAIRQVAGGAVVVPPPMSTWLVAEISRLGTSPEADLSAPWGLSRREMEVLRKVARGSSNAVIAAEMFLSVNTVKNHVRSAAHKLGTTSRTEAALKAVKEGLIDLHDVDL